PVGGMDVVAVGDIVTVVLQGRRIEREQPDGRYSEVLEVIQFTQQPLEIANPVVIGVTKGLNVELINEGFFKPNRASWFGDFLCLNGWNLHRLIQCSVKGRTRVSSLQLPVCGRQRAGMQEG